MEWGTITSTVIMLQGFVLVPCSVAMVLMTLDVWRRSRLEAENERLREALENVRRVMHLPRAEDAANRAVDIAMDALTTPPSSTEGTE